MKAAYIEQPGPPENITFGDLPKPKPGDGPGARQGQGGGAQPGRYLRPRRHSTRWSCRGRLWSDAIWPAWSRRSVRPSTKYRKGDRVWGSNQGLLGRQGTFAEYAAVDECWLYPTPDEVADQDIAAMALVGITAHLVCSASATEDRRVGFHRRRQRWRRLVRDPDGPRGRRPRAGHGPHRRATCRCAANSAPHARSITRRTDLDEALGKFGPIDVWFETRREQDFDQAVEPFGHARADRRDGRARVAAQVSRRPVLRERRQAHWALRCSTPRPRTSGSARRRSIVGWPKGGFARGSAA